MELRVAITGLGAVTPGARSPEAVWRRLERPAAATQGPWPHRDWRGHFFDAEVTCSSIAAEAARQALGDRDGPPPWLIVGTCSADIRHPDPPWMRHEAGLPVEPGSVLWPELPQQTTALVRRALGLRTPGWSVSTACTSGTVALATAAELVASGQAPRALAVGADVIGRLTWFGFGAVGLQSSGPCLPFDRGRTGLNLGEGAAALLLERPRDARARGVPILGYVTGVGNATDAYHLSAPDPAGAAAERALRQALGGQRPGWANAHGTGTPLNDAMEATVLRRLDPGLPVTASKGALGHTLGAAGTLEAVVTALGLLREEIPPSRATPAPEFDLDLVTVTRRAPVRSAVTLNLAFGGSNVAILLEAP